MKQAILFIALIISTLCPNTANAQCDKTSFSIVLLGGFHKDRVELLIDNKKVFDKIITSDMSTGSADACSFKKLSCNQKVVTIINGHKMPVIYLDHSKIHKKLLGIHKQGNSVSTSFYDIPLILE
ncbi:MAG: hypothetical protein M3Y54_14535 [Bacteroidota bacterium]|nr:hypothetical protein [Bacteroidota bacterium]